MLFFYLSISSIWYLGFLLKRILPTKAVKSMHLSRKTLRSRYRLKIYSCLKIVFGENTKLIYVSVHVIVSHLTGQAGVFNFTWKLLNLLLFSKQAIFNLLHVVLPLKLVIGKCLVNPVVVSRKPFLTSDYSWGFRLA